MVHFDPSAVKALIGGQPPYAGCKGSVVRLRVTDFMTYHSAELRSGAHVNLILGPNGSGKSTIVCAICLGLAGKPKILGRALKVSQNHKKSVHVNNPKVCY
ncbi:Structural maintenance of chromosomes protein 5 [Orchesella cincta]|uniref:Structural maintenance of chromosomes protein 5 n=1 Tax=Orchesella cincta TaxID=48709 RepID=A0A1D2MZ02_ORCCI|nr:Structural maintenance of chromosomes protein 5 [Orchesella cincta]